MATSEHDRPAVTIISWVGCDNAMRAGQVSIPPLHFLPGGMNIGWEDRTVAQHPLSCSVTRLSQRTPYSNTRPLSRWACSAVQCGGAGLNVNGGRRADRVILDWSYSVSLSPVPQSHCLLRFHHERAVNRCFPTDFLENHCLTAFSYL